MDTSFSTFKSKQKNLLVKQSNRGKPKSCGLDLTTKNYDPFVYIYDFFLNHPGVKRVKREIHGDFSFLVYICLPSFAFLAPGESNRSELRFCLAISYDYDYSSYTSGSGSQC